MERLVDWHAHWVPPQILDILAERRLPPHLVDGPEGRVFVVDRSFAVPVKEAQLDLDLRLAEMDRHGVAQQVLSLAVVLGCFLARLPEDLERTLVEANNRGLAELVARRGDRFQGLAALPTAAPELAPAILEKAVTQQGLLGAILPADAFADKRTASRYRPLFAAAHRLGAHLFIHPAPIRETVGDQLPADEAQLIRRRAVDFQNRVTAAAVTFEYTDYLDPYPGLTLHLANLAGNLPLLADRIAMTAERMALPAPLAGRRLLRCVADTASFGPAGIGLAALTLGADRLLFGSDSPALALGPAVAALSATPLEKGMAAAIGRGDALLCRAERPGPDA